MSAVRSVQPGRFNFGEANRYVDDRWQIESLLECLLNRDGADARRLGTTTTALVQPSSADLYGSNEQHHVRVGIVKLNARIDREASGGEAEEIGVVAHCLKLYTPYGLHFASGL